MENIQRRVRGPIHRHDTDDPGRPHLPCLNWHLDCFHDQLIEMVGRLCRPLDGSRGLRHMGGSCLPPHTNPPRHRKDSPACGHFHVPSLRDTREAVEAAGCSSRGLAVDLRKQRLSCHCKKMDRLGYPPPDPSHRVREAPVHHHPRLCSALPIRMSANKKAPGVRAWGFFILCGFF